MVNPLIHEIELCPPETFRILLEHEVNRSHRYGDSLSLVHGLVEADPFTPANQLSAEVFMINALNVHLRATDVASKKGNYFRLLLPATGAQGARTACERLKKLMTVEAQPYDRVSFKLYTFIGLATLPEDDPSVTRDILTQHAVQALEHARMHRLTGVIYFSDLPK